MMTQNLKENSSYNTNNLDNENIAKLMFTSKPKKIDTSFTIDFKYVLKRILYRTENKLFEKELIDFLEEPIKKSLFYSNFKEINCQNEKSNNINLDKYNHLDEYVNRYLDMKLKQNRIDTFSSSSIGYQ